MRNNITPQQVVVCSCSIVFLERRFRAALCTSVCVCISNVMHYEYKQSRYILLRSSLPCWWDHAQRSQQQLRVPHQKLNVSGREEIPRQTRTTRIGTQLIRLNWYLRTACTITPLTSIQNAHTQTQLLLLFRFKHSRTYRPKHIWHARLRIMCLQRSYYRQHKTAVHHSEIAPKLKDRL